MKEMLTIEKGMHIGGERIRRDEDLTFYRQMGVEYVDATPLWQSLENGYWRADTLVKWREHVESFDLKLVAMHLPFSPPFSLAGEGCSMEEQRWQNVMLGTPGRDRDIEQICKCVEAVGKAGIPLLLYGLSAGGSSDVLRSPGWTTGRGGIRYYNFDYDKMRREPPYPAAPMNVEQAWERIEYFIKRVIPVAEEYKVKMACHPQDVPVPPGTTHRGIVPVLSNIDGLKRFVDLDPSPYHGLLFCQGCIAEFSTDPEQVYEAIRYFGSRKKIFWVHFRNIRGGLRKFEETFPDEGDIDMAKTLRAYKKVGYNGVLVPDHVPRSDLDTPLGHHARAFCLGYIKALIQAVESES